MIASINDLFKESRKLTYPENMKMIPEMKDFFWFFPGGFGTADKSTDAIQKKFMFLGQDWGTLDMYNQPKASPSVINVKKFIGALGKDINDCFFTNAIMGMRAGGSSTGKSPATKYPEFMSQCRDFLKIQIAEVKPEFVFVLGKETAHFVAKAYDIKDWIKLGNIMELFNSGKFSQSLDKEKVKFIYMTHPSLRPTNISKRWKEQGDIELDKTRKEIEKSIFLLQ